MTAQSNTDRTDVPGATWLLFGVFGAPLAWALQLVVDYALAAYPCFVRGTAQTALIPGWEHARAALVVITLVALAIDIGAIAAAWLAGRRAHVLATRGRVPAALVERTRALAYCGLISGSIFLVATLFSLAMLVRIPQCTG